MKLLDDINHQSALISNDATFSIQPTPLHTSRISVPFKISFTVQENTIMHPHSHMIILAPNNNVGGNNSETTDDNNEHPQTHTLPSDDQEEY